ncbi:5'-3' exoribonuclease 2 homolog [Palaemon carinicauda]|uniref:5'-3' exoribonuclease 2 homolog n=1 Tax=Palaemon carinicauda TaxID=392227 RepID=UPI0035B692AF
MTITVGVFIYPPKGYKLPPEKPKEAHFDSNCITPGTPFMDRLSKCLHYYVHERLNTDPAWRNIKVVLSDANVPGEGEHKIMDYIRRQRAQPDHDPDTHHVLCGADADLIMLGLATHEVNFTIIREEFKPNKPRPCDVCGQLGHEMVDCLGLEGDSAGNEPEKVYEEQRYIFVRLNVLREYLERELGMPNLPFKYDFDRAIDDWVFMCFFVGNDFLPHLPSLEIRENAIDRLVNLYKDCCYKTGGWLTDSGSANMRRVQMILQNLGKVEDQIFKNRQKKELEFKARDKAQKRQQKMDKEAAYRFLIRLAEYKTRKNENNLFPRQAIGYHLQDGNYSNKE